MTTPGHDGEHGGPMDRTKSVWRDAHGAREDHHDGGADGGQARGGQHAPPGGPQPTENGAVPVAYQGPPRMVGPAGQRTAAEHAPGCAADPVQGRRGQERARRPADARTDRGAGGAVAGAAADVAAEQPAAVHARAGRPPAGRPPAGRPPAAQPAAAAASIGPTAAAPAVGPQPVLQPVPQPGPQPMSSRCRSPCPAAPAAAGAARRVRPEPRGAGHHLASRARPRRSTSPPRWRSSVPIMPTASRRPPRI